MVMVSIIGIKIKLNIRYSKIITKDIGFKEKDKALVFSFIQMVANFKVTSLRIPSKDQVLYLTNRALQNYKYMLTIDLLHIVDRVHLMIMINK